MLGGLLLRGGRLFAACGQAQRQAAGSHVSEDV
jgi:hypothetical protein